MPVSREKDSPPVPDPTILTTEAVERASKVFEGHIASLKVLIDEKLVGVNKQLDLIEKQRVEQKADTKAAVDAALTAQKEAVREQTLASEKAIQKSETATTKQLEQLSETFTTSIANLTKNLDDLKTTVGGMVSERSGGKQAYAGIYAALGGIVLIITIGLFLFANKGP